MTDVRAELEAIATGLATASAAAGRLAARWPAESASPALERDLRVAEVARLLGCSTSAVRGRVEAGRFVGAYKLGRAWRVPESALAAFRAAQQSRTPRQDAPGRAITTRQVSGPHLPRARAGAAPNLGAWRQLRSPKP